MDQSHNPMPKEYTVARALAELIVNTACEDEKVIEEKIEAIRKLYGRICNYEKDSFDGKLLDLIMEKKVDMIMRARLLRDIREIVDLPKPHFDGNAWQSSRYSVPEEEMILWSKASMIAPLSHEGAMRYIKLFKQCYGKLPDWL